MPARMHGRWASVLATLVILGALLPVGGAGVLAQNQGSETYRIQFKKRQFIPTPGLEIAAIQSQRAALPDAASVGTAHFLIQFNTLPDAAERSRLAAQGINLIAYVTGNAYIATTATTRLNTLAAAVGARWAGPLAPADKIAPQLTAGAIAPWAQAAQGQVALTIQFHQDVALADARAVIGRLGGRVVDEMPSNLSISALFDPSQVQQIAGEDAVQYVDVVDLQLEAHNDAAANAANVTPLRTAPYSLNGAGVTVLVYDGGRADAAHPDFGARIIQNDGSNISEHATHVAGTVGGSGANSNGTDSAGTANGGTANQWMGMAPGVNIRSFGSTGTAADFYDGNGGDLNADFTTAINNGIDLATMSLGNNVFRFATPPCGQLGDYSNTALLIDNIVRGSIAGQQLIYFESAGNERGDPDGAGPRAPAPCGQFSTISSPATAKNSIAVGAINSNDNSMTGFSSFGPTDDGRIKPDISAPGCRSNGPGNIISTGFIDANNNGFLDAGETRNSYSRMCGTSMATPVAAGATALLVEQWRRTRGGAARPLSHTVKAILVHTATDRGLAGPDYQFGWGSLDARAAVDLVRADDSANLISVDQADNGVTDFYTFNSNGSSSVKVTLAWDDPAATRLATPTLINNLNLRLVGPDGVTYQPFVLNAGTPGNIAATGDDTTNNVEMVVAPAQAGTWTVQVIGAAVPQGPQQYTLITPTDAAANNQPPAAVIGGPYTTDEGADIALNGAGSSDPNGDPLTYAWDLDNDGAFDDATGSAPIFDRVGQDGVYPIALRVTDSHGAFATATDAVTVNNVAPSITLNPGTLNEGATGTLIGTVSDPGWLDTLSATIDWGDGAPPEPIGGTLENTRPDATLTFSSTHLFGDNGSFSASICVADDDTNNCTPLALTINNITPTVEISRSATVPVNGIPTFLLRAHEDLLFYARSQDPGSDDLALSWDWDDSGRSPDRTTLDLVNPPTPDPLPSPSVQPRDVTDRMGHDIDDPCVYTVTFEAADDDGGVGVDEAPIVVQGKATRTLSYSSWRRQFRDVERADFSGQRLVCYLSIAGYMSRVFDETRDASTTAAAYAVLTLPSHPSARDQFDRQLLAVWLNFANGSIAYDELVDTDGRHGVDTPFAEVIAAAEAVRLDPAATDAQIKAQKKILDRIKH
jgi:hypothetical protein